jgi:hypothetical protein
VKEIIFLTQPDAILYPLNLINLSDMKLDGFNWRIEDRPEKVEDIFDW